MKHKAISTILAAMTLIASACNDGSGAGSKSEDPNHAEEVRLAEEARAARDYLVGMWTVTDEAADEWAEKAAQATGEDTDNACAWWKGAVMRFEADGILVLSHYPQKFEGTYDVTDAQGASLEVNVTLGEDDLRWTVTPEKRRLRLLAPILSKGNELVMRRADGRFAPAATAAPATSEAGSAPALECRTCRGRGKVKNFTAGYGRNCGDYDGDSYNLINCISGFHPNGGNAIANYRLNRPGENDGYFACTDCFRMGKELARARSLVVNSISAYPSEVACSDCGGKGTR